MAGVQILIGVKNNKNKISSKMKFRFFFIVEDTQHTL